MMIAIAAGKMEKSAHIIHCTDCSLRIVTTVSPVTALVEEMSPAAPSSKAIREPDMALPSFCAIVPEEKISPVEEVPFCCVA